MINFRISVTHCLVYRNVMFYQYVKGDYDLYHHIEFYIFAWCCRYIDVSRSNTAIIGSQKTNNPNWTNLEF